MLKQVVSFSRTWMAGLALGLLSAMPSACLNTGGWCIDVYPFTYNIGVKNQCKDVFPWMIWDGPGDEDYEYCCLEQPENFQKCCPGGEVFPDSSIGYVSCKTDKPFPLADNPDACPPKVSYGADSSSTSPGDDNDEPTTSAAAGDGVPTETSTGTSHGSETGVEDWDEGVANSDSSTCSLTGEADRDFLFVR